MSKIFPILLICLLHFPCFSMNYDKSPLDQHKMTTCRDSNWVIFSVKVKEIGHSSIHADLCQGPVVKMLNIEGHIEPFCLLLANKKDNIPCCKELLLSLKERQGGFIKDNVEKGVKVEKLGVSIVSSESGMAIDDLSKMSTNAKTPEKKENITDSDQSACLFVSDVYASGKSFGVFYVNSEKNSYTLVSGALSSVSNYVNVLADRAKLAATEKCIDNPFAKYTYYGVSFSNTGYDAKDVSQSINTIENSITDNFYRNDIITFFPFVKNQTSLFIDTARGATSGTFSIDSNPSCCGAAKVNKDAIYMHLYEYKGSDFSNSVIYMPAGHNAQEGRICMHRLTH